MSTATVPSPVRKVFCSHRQVDKPKVTEVARQLCAANIDAWLDTWEIKPGDDVVAAINHGLSTYDVALIFFSSETEHGKWMQAEVSAITSQAIEEGRPVIPVMLDPTVPIPPLLKSRCRLGYGQIDQLVDAIQGHTGKPPLPGGSLSAGRQTFVVSVRRVSDGVVGVRAQFNGSASAAEQQVRIEPRFAPCYESFLHPRPGADNAETLRLERDKLLRELGSLVGRILFAGDIESRLADLLRSSEAASETLELIVVSDSASLLSIPFEAARLANGAVPALQNGVRMSRRLAGLPVKGRLPLPGPLKILAAVGAPDEDKTANSVLDGERELQSILDAVEEARVYGNAYVRILNVGSLEQIQKALQEQAYHVLHISGHGTADRIELEDEDGSPRTVSASDLAAAIRNSGHPAPLVVLSSCMSGAIQSETVNFTQGLLAKGVPAVVAMQTSVTDDYATRLMAEFYANLSQRHRPLAGDALALARQKLEQERLAELAHGRQRPAEYATPSLWFSTEDTSPGSRARHDTAGRAGARFAQRRSSVAFRG